MDSQGTRHTKSIIGTNLRLARESLGWTQRRFAYELGGWDPTAISRWEKGRVRIGDEKLIEVARVLGKDIAWFYVDRPEEEAA